MHERWMRAPVRRGQALSHADAVSRYLIAQRCGRMLAILPALSWGQP